MKNKKILIAYLAALTLTSMAYSQKVEVEMNTDSHKGTKIVKIEKNGKVTIDTFCIDDPEEFHLAFADMEVFSDAEADSLEKRIEFIVEHHMEGTHPDSLERVFVNRMNHSIMDRHPYLEHMPVHHQGEPTDDAMRHIAEKEGWTVTEYKRELKNGKEKIVIVREKKQQ